MINNNELNSQTRKYIRLLQSQKRVICGYNQNIYGQAVVTTGIPREYNEGIITYTKQKTESYENYMLRKSLKK